METLKNLVLHNLPRKLFSLILASSIWLYISYSSLEEKMFPKIVVRVVNMPPDKTIRGLMPNGTLETRLSITLLGKKDLINRLERKDFEIVIDAADRADQWVVKLDKRNLVSRNPDIDFLRDIVKITHTDFIIHFSKMASSYVPVYFRGHTGELPDGYQFVGVTPSTVTHFVSGPEEDIKKLCKEGLELSFDFNLVNKEQLNSIANQNMSAHNEVSWLVPDQWKKVAIPFLGGIKQDLSSPEAKKIFITFLKQELLPIGNDIPISVYYPLTTLKEYNPTTCPLQPSQLVEWHDSVSVIHRPLFVKTVSRKFLDIVKDHLQILIISEPSKKEQKLHWEVRFVNLQQLEDLFVARSLDMKPELPLNDPSNLKRAFIAQQEKPIRNRFREYKKRFCLYEANGIPLNLNIVQNAHGILISD